MTDAFTTTYEFEEIRLAGEGLMAWGTATLEGDEYGFDVTEIVLDGGHKLLPTGEGFMGVPVPSNQILFRMIRDVLENDPQVQSDFAEKLEADNGAPVRADYRQYSTTNHAQQGIGR